MAARNLPQRFTEAEEEAHERKRELSKKKKKNAKTFGPRVLAQKMLEGEGGNRKGGGETHDSL